MKQKNGITGIYLLGALAAQAGNYTVKSPDGKLAVNVSCEGGKGLLSSIKKVPSKDVTPRRNLFSCFLSILNLLNCFSSILYYLFSNTNPPSLV